MALVFLSFSLVAGTLIANTALAQPRIIPKTWDEKSLADWATPLARLNARPSHISAEQYYALPVDNLRTYPVYLPGREPEGYWNMLSRIGPKPMIQPEQLRSEEDWIEAGRTVFQQMITCISARSIRCLSMR